MAVTTVNGASTIGAAKSASSAAADKLQTNYQDFLKLLTTQLQNQDPTAPADTNQLTQQIATLSQVEQQINTNKNLEKLISMFNTNSLSNSASYIGKQVESLGNKTMLESGRSTLAYDLDATANKVTINITNASGATVRTLEGTGTTGRNEIVWDGKDGTGKQLEDGSYTFQITAKDAANADVKTTSYTIGTVSSLSTQNGVTNLMMGDTAVALDKVLSIRGGAGVGTIDVSYIGKQVETEGNQGMLLGGAAAFLYNLDKAADNVKVTIKDARGNTVVVTNGTKLAGRNEVYWDGKDASGNQMEDGIYSIQVEAKDANGAVINSTTRTIGTVTSIDSVAGKTILSIGDIKLGIDKVLSVRQPVTAVGQVG